MTATPKDDGGAAFPNVPDGAGDKWEDWDKGMSLRDYFAAEAMKASTPFIKVGADAGNCAQFARHCYALADSMLAERAK